MKTPLGVTVLSILAFMAGIMHTVWGLRMMGWMTFGPLEAGSGVWLAGLLTLVVGIIYLGVGGALASLKPWALTFAQIMAVFGLVNAVFALFATGSLQVGIGEALLPGFVFWYTNRPDVVAAFARNAPRR